MQTAAHLQWYQESLKAVEDTVDGGLPNTSKPFKFCECTYVSPHCCSYPVINFDHNHRHWFGIINKETAEVNGITSYLSFVLLQCSIPTRTPSVAVKEIGFATRVS